MIRHLLIISKELYEFCTSGQRFNELLRKFLLSLGFEHSKCEADIWIIDAGKYYEYVATYVDDLAVILKDPQKFFKQLQSTPFNFKLKGTASIDGAIHLQCAFGRDQHGILYMDPNQYIKQMEEAYKYRFDDNPDTHVQFSLDPGDHPELDTSDFLNKDDTKIYQSLIAAMQWAISIGRWDILLCFSLENKVMTGMFCTYYVYYIMGHNTSQYDCKILYATGIQY